MSDFLQVGTDEYIPLRDVVFKTLRKAILSGDLKPGEKLREVNLAQRMGVSRTPIREAIRMLELEGLVVMIPRRGAEVAGITRKDLKDMMEIRVVLDLLAIELACERRTEEQLERLEKVRLEFEENLGTSGLTKTAKLDESFHAIIVEMAGNEKLSQIVKNISDQIYRYRYETLKDESQYDDLKKEHLVMAEAIRDQKKETAMEVVRKHIERQENSITKKLKLQ